MAVRRRPGARRRHAPRLEQRAARGDRDAARADPRRARRRERRPRPVAAGAGAPAARRVSRGPGARGDDAGPTSRASCAGVRLVFLAVAAFAAAVGWLVGHPLPFIVALVIAGVDMLETSFLLLVVAVRRDPDGEAERRKARVAPAARSRSRVAATSGARPVGPIGVVPAAGRRSRHAGPARRRARARARTARRRPRARRSARSRRGRARAAAASWARDGLLDLGRASLGIGEEHADEPVGELHVADRREPPERRRVDPRVGATHGRRRDRPSPGSPSRGGRARGASGRAPARAPRPRSASRPGRPSPPRASPRGPRARCSP